jgi:fatty-acid desaturase
VLITIIFPTIVPVLLWKEAFWIAFWVNVLRYTLNFTQLNIGNGLLHYNGLKPYDRNITAKESKLWIFCTLGEGKMKNIQE